MASPPWAIVAPSPSIPERLLVFSDVHLGSDLNDRGQSPRRTSDIDSDLVELLRHYGAMPSDAERWRVVIAGDFIDFIGMTVAPSDASDGLTTELTEEEHKHGLGSSADHARVKLQRVATRHSNVFDALAELLAGGHALTVVHGNHDVEFHWDEVKADFRDLLLSRALAVRPDLDAEAFLGRIDFEPWFYYWKGVAYIEHGHQYDPYCANDHVMAPLSPLDPRRVMRGFSSILLRFVVRQTRGMTEHGHEQSGVFDYLRFAARLGVRGLFGLAARFTMAVVELFRLRRAHFSSAIAALHAEHERRIGLLAEATRLGIDRIRSLVALQVPPVTRSIRGILASVLLDRIALAVLSVLLLIVVAIVGAYRGHVLYAGLGVALAWFLVHKYLSRQRQLDPADEMVNRATALSRLLPAAFVVMGHTHLPVEQSIPGGDARYINLGSWAEEEDDQGFAGVAYRAARTHLVIEVQEGQAQAELRAWAPDGPQRFNA